MEKIRELGNLAGATIIEHRDGGEKPVVGRIDDFTVQGGGQLVVGWHHVNGGNRTTMFSPARWRCEIANRVVSLHRVKPDPLEMDMPWISANLYTIEQQKNN